MAATSTGGKLIYFVFNTSSGLPLKNIWIFSPVFSSLFCLSGEVFPRMRWLCWKKDLENHQNRETLSGWHMCGINLYYWVQAHSWLEDQRLMFHCQHWICHFLHQKNIFHIIIILKTIKYLSVRHLSFFAVDLDFDSVKESESTVKVCV